MERPLLCILVTLAMTSCRSSNRIAGGRLRRLVAVSLWAAAGLLLIFHVWLFLGHLSDGRLLAPAVLVRWVAGAGLFGLLLWFRRMGVPLVWGRRALVLWVMVFFLHASAHAPSAPGATAPGSPGASLVLVIVPTAAAIVTLARILCRVGASRVPAITLGRPMPCAVGARFRADCRGAFGFAFAPRPPPRSGRLSR